MARHMANLGASQCPQPLQISKGRLRQVQALAFHVDDSPPGSRGQTPKEVT